MPSKKDLLERIEELEAQVRCLENMHATVLQGHSWELPSFIQRGREWEDKYKNKQKIQSLTLEKSRLLANRRIYKELDQQDLVDRTTERIKTIRSKIKELEE